MTPFITPAKGRRQKALFLDRDGIINENHGYVYRREDCDFIEEIFELAKAAQAKGYLIIIVTNQSGIAREYYTQQAFFTFSRWLEHEFWRRGIRITHTYHCPHHPKVGGTFGRPCCCRKPRPGMIFRAMRQFGIKLNHSVMIGDSTSDILCAQRARVGQRVLFKQDTSKSSHHTPALERKARGHFVARNLRAITALL